MGGSGDGYMAHTLASSDKRAIQFAVTKLFGTGSQVPLLLVIDAI
jgi:hypothetical protein